MSDNQGFGKSAEAYCEAGFKDPAEWLAVSDRPCMSDVAYMLLRAFHPRLDTSLKMRKSWGLPSWVESKAVIQSHRKTADVFCQIFRAEGECSGQQALDLYLRYSDGTGVRKDLGRAAYWLRIAVDAKHPEAVSVMLYYLSHRIVETLGAYADMEEMQMRFQRVIELALECSQEWWERDPKSVGGLIADSITLRANCKQFVSDGQYGRLQTLRERWLLAHEHDQDFWFVSSSLRGADKADVSDRARPAPSEPRIKQSMVVCSKPIEGKELAERYGMLNQSVALRGLPDIVTLKAALNREFPWMVDITERVIAQLCLARYLARDVFRLPPILLVGPPGSGKTRYAQRLAELANVPSTLISIGGSADNRALQGTARGWGTATPSLIAQTIVRDVVANPVIILDELEKASADRRNGSVWDTLHLMLEPQTARRWFDECLLSPCDFGMVSYMATANGLKGIPHSLLSRFSIFLVPLPGEQDRHAIVMGIMADVAAELNVSANHLPPLRPEDWEAILAYSGESVRAAKQLIRDLLALRAEEAIRPQMMH